MSERSEIERELKFAAEELNTLRERLVELEAERVSPASSEENWVLDRGSELQASGCILRLRKDRSGAILTYKGPAVMDGGVKLRRELETRVEDLEQMRRVFEQLGYHMVRRYQKVREEWRLGGVKICLDHTPIGDFVEFEGTGAETVAKRCGFDPKEAERRNYLRLYEDYVKEHPDASPDMVFP